MYPASSLSRRSVLGSIWSTYLGKDFLISKCCLSIWLSYCSISLVFCTAVSTFELNCSIAVHAARQSFAPYLLPFQSTPSTIPSGTFLSSRSRYTPSSIFYVVCHNVKSFHQVHEILTKLYRNSCVCHFSENRSAQFINFLFFQEELFNAISALFPSLSVSRELIASFQEHHCTKGFLYLFLR